MQRLLGFAKLVLGFLVFVGLVLAWRAVGKPGQQTYYEIVHHIQMSFIWRDFVSSRQVKANAPALYPMAVPIPLGVFEYGCKPGRDVPLGNGCPQDEAVRTVDLRKLAKPCNYMGKAEVTFEQYDHYVWSQRHLPTALRPPYPEAPGGRRDTHPVVNVSHDEAVAYTQWLSQVTNQTWRLPSEEEWEYAARAIHPDRPGGKEGSWWWGNEPPSVNGRANCNDCDTRSDGIGEKTASFKPNAFGLYDTVGNVAEWTSSIYTPDNRPAPAGKSGQPHVRRGGSFAESAEDTRVSTRHYSRPDLHFSTIGFRVCKVS